MLPLNAPVEKQKCEMNILKLKDFIMLRNILFVKGCLNGNAPGSFNDKFHSSKLPLNHTTRSSSTYQLKVVNFKWFTLVLQFTVMKYTLIHSFNHSFILWFIHSFIHSIVLVVMAIVVHVIILFYLCFIFLNSEFSFSEFSVVWILVFSTKWVKAISKQNK